MSKIKATLIRHERDSLTFKALPTSEVEIVADSEDELLALYFREYDNRYKYCNNLSFSFKDPALTVKYRTWFSDVSNYANNGGDIW